MRAQSKPFIVEVKSSRRVDRSKEKSIWGNIDLSAIADEVAPEPAEAPHAASEEDGRAALR
ncbi:MULTISPECIES: hypothetical protein [unclassified Rhizobium]|jgi:hypothetical protein|uniref:hypothetical protein n=1 Tax=unclassified Rhizobium TaxID=2613769 RepID=UPI000DD8983B|nr:hypothetical protein [Rhizobium sp. BG4]QRM44925.1 hypothetical protein F2982_16665 [Rhizobium sp. BG4]